MHVLHNFWGGCHKYNSLTVWPIQSSSPPTKELYGQVKKCFARVRLVDGCVATQNVQVQIESALCLDTPFFGSSDD